MVIKYSSFSLPSFQRQTAVLPESQSTKTSTNEQENAGMLLLDVHQVLGLSMTGKLVPCCSNLSLLFSQKKISELIVLLFMP